MKIAIPKEIFPGEKRVALIPDTIKRLKSLGADIAVESGLGLNCHYTDALYQQAGAFVHQDRRRLITEADLILRIRKPPQEEVAWLKKGAIHISYLDPFQEKDLTTLLVQQGVSAFSMEMIPRITRAQKMDSLSSQASLAGYVAVILAAERFFRIFPMMMTPAGTLSPARVFIIGVGVAGLQAIATAKRLGARVEAFDTRPVVEEQVKSLGAKFVKIDLGETGQTKDGYARALSSEQLEKQRLEMKKYMSLSDIVITTAQVFGKRAPRIITKDMIEGMRPGSVVVDMAVESGGNVESVQIDQEIDLHGVKVLGMANLPGRVCVHASQMYSANMGSFVEEFWNKEKNEFKIKLEDEIIKGCLITHQGQIVNEMIKNSKS